MPLPLTVVLAVRNEELTLPLCLETLRGRVGQIVVVVGDDSTDRTLEIARELATDVLLHPTDGVLGRARNRGVAAARHEWVLGLDGDERVAVRDLERLGALLRPEGPAAWSLPVRNYRRHLDLLWDWHPNDGAYPEEEALSGCPGWSRSRVVRLFRSWARWEEVPSGHTGVLPSIRAAGGAVGEGDVPLHHLEILKGGEEAILRKEERWMELEQVHLAARPTDPLSLLNLGKTLFAQGRDADAEAHLRRALELDPADEGALLVLGMVLRETGRPDEAAEVLRRAASVDAAIVRGMALDDLGRWTEAREALASALARSPRHPMAHNSLGIVLERLGLRAEAERHYLEALAAHPDFRDASANLEMLRTAP